MADETAVKKWTYKAGSMLAGSPSLGPDKTCYVGCRDGKLYAVDADGRLRWTVETGGPVDAAPCVHPSGMVVFGSYDGQLRAVAPSGEVKWSLDAGAPVMTTPCVDDDGQLWFGADNGCLYVLSEEGRQLGRVTISDMIAASPICVGGTVWVAGDELWGSDGTRLEFAAEPVTAAAAAGADGTLYIGSWDSHVYAIRDRAVRWKAKLNGQIYAACSIGTSGEVLARSRGAEVVALDPENGERLWTRPTKDGVYGTPAVTASDTAWVGSNSNWLHMLSLESGQKEFSSFLGRDIRSSVALADDGTVYAASWDWHLYAFETTTGGPANTSWPQFQGNAARTGRPRTPEPAEESNELPAEPAAVPSD